jgi:hypothetical protein
MRRLTVPVAVAALALSLAAVPAAAAATPTAAEKRVARDLSHGFVKLSWTYAQELGMSRASFERLAAPAGVETIQGSAGCSSKHIVKRAASGDVYGQACALHSGLHDSWAAWWRVECHYYNSARLQPCNFKVKYPTIASFSSTRKHTFPEANTTGKTVWESNTPYHCTGFVNGERVQVQSSPFSPQGVGDGENWAVRFSNGNYSNGWFNNGTTFTLGTSCNVS